MLYICLINETNKSELKEIYLGEKSLRHNIYNPDYLKYSKLNGIEKVEYYITILLNSINTLKDKYDLPLSEIKEGIQKFRNLGYRNEWVHKKKLYRPLSITFFLECEMTMEEFNLYLTLRKKKETLLKKCILTTDPDEIAFHYKFKDIVFENNKVTIKGLQGYTLFESAIDELLSGIK
ncbi:hypothetical protein GCM10023331_20090 [Algivirga pacifica]|uniref:Uncharacterized protein n=2 Tax=Algivirga pacifica TaxID=1162670 RepID=A0ABP9DCV8_9BACT